MILDRLGADIAERALRAVAPLQRGAFTILPADRPA